MRLFSILLLSVSLILPGFVPAQSIVFKCGMSGESHAACCCAPKSADSVSCGSSACGCCDIELKATPRDPAAPTGSATPHIQLRTVTIHPTDHAPAFPSQDSSPLRARLAPPWRAHIPPAYILNASLLR